MGGNDGRVNGIWDWVKEGRTFVASDVTGSVLSIEESLDDSSVIENLGGDVFILPKLEMKFEIRVPSVLNSIDLSCGRR